MRIYSCEVQSIISKNELVEVVYHFSKENNLNVGIKEVEYVVNDLIKNGYLKKADNNMLKTIKHDKNNEYYTIGDEYKIYLIKKVEENKNKQLIKIANLVSCYTVDFKMNLDSALNEIRGFMLQSNK